MRRIRGHASAVLVAGFVVAAVLVVAGRAWTVWQEAADGGDAESATDSPAGRSGRSSRAGQLADLHQRTVTATRLRYRWGLVVEPAGDHGSARVEVQDEGAFDAGGHRAWRTTTVIRDGEPLPPRRVIVDRDRLFLQPGPASATLGLEPDDWLTARGATDDVAWTEVGLPRPAGQLCDLLRDAGTDVQEVGEEVIHGVPATHLRLPVVEPAVEEETSPGRPPEAVDVWIDAEQRLRRIQRVVAPHVIQRLDLFDHGTAVRLALPDAPTAIVDARAILPAVVTALVDAPSRRGPPLAAGGWAFGLS